ncbi:MAG: hypothetical protein, partial [Olavius algarvensis Gamma 1 endosymbiont]
VARAQGERGTGMSRFASRARRHSEKRPSKYSNIGTLKNPPFSKKIYV